MDTTAKTEFVGHAANAEPKRAWIFTRPTATKGIVSWLTTVDHKKVGLLYGFAALSFFLIGGFEALLIRIQLAVPNNTFLTHDQYNEMFTMHATTMIFLAIMPLASAFFNYIMPLQIGARDVAFPRFNGFAFWVFLVGAIVLNIGWFIKSGGPHNGWFGYAPLTSNNYGNLFRGDISTDLWIMGLQILGVSSVIGSLNFIVTIINLRAPGMTMMRLPVFTWMTLITSFLIVLSFPAITIALVELMMDRSFGANFFEASHGGLPILWQHLFWVFGHPEVYILILPAMGIVSEILPTFSRKALFGYPIIVFSGASIGFLGFGVWSHHMFATGLGTAGTAAFSLMTMAIAVPTGVKMFNWIGTLWGGHLRMRTPMMFALGFLWMFMMGGFSGLMHAAAPSDAQQHDTYFIVAHFHYVLIGGALFALLAGVHYWFPLIFGRIVSEFWGKLSFWVIFIGFNTTFFPMHFLGLNGMPRRTAVYDSNMGWDGANMTCTVGAFILGIGVAIYFGTLIYTLLHGQKAGVDPWDARTLEWSIKSPPPDYNYAVTPIVRARDAYWYEKHAKDAPAKAANGHGGHGIHMPSQSWFPILTALGLLIGAIFFVNHIYPGAIVGALIMVTCGALWALEGPGGYHVHPEDDDHGHGPSGH